MASKNHFRRGLVGITDLGNGTYRLRWPGRGGDKRFTSETKKAILKIADGINRTIYAQKGYLPGTRKAIPSLHDAIAEAIRLSKQGRDERIENARNGGRFLTWMEKRYPSVKTFDQLKPYMIQEYINEAEDRGYIAKRTKRRTPYKLDAITAFIKPIRFAWNHILDNCHEAGLQRWPKIKIKTRKSPKLPQLKPQEIQILFKILKEHHPDYYPVAVMQALTGLRPVEIRSLRRQDVDLQRGVISVLDTETHETKTETSCREIPVCSEVLTVLRETINSQKVVPSTGEIFLRTDGTPWTEQSLTKRWDPEVRRSAAKLAGCPRLAEVTAYRLRASFSTMAGLLGIHKDLLKPYFGHSDKDMLDRHYQEVPLSALRKVAAAFEGWRDLPNEDEFGEYLGNSSEGKLGSC